MKRFGKVLGLAVLTAAAAVFMGCPTPNSKNDDDTGGGTGTNLWDTEGIELIASLANRSTSWGEAIKVPSSYAKRLQVGSKVIFELNEYDNGTAGPYLKFHVDKGDWTEVGVTKYYDANGTELSVEEDSNNKGVYNSDSVDAGTYYFEVTDTNLNKLKAGFALNGNLTVVRLGITNLAEAEQPAPDAAVYSGDEIVLKVIADSVPDNDEYKTKLRLQYFRENNKKQEITFSNLDLSVTIGDDVIAMNDEYSFELNDYGNKNEDGKSSEYDLDLLLGKELKKDDTVKVQLKKANITGDDDITDDIIASIKVIIFDNAPNAGGENKYYQKLSADNEEKPLITKKNGAPISPAPAE